MSITPGQTYSAAVASPGRKDAFHVAAVLCKKSPLSQYNLDPCDRVCILDGKFASWTDHETHYDGIVDPFLTERITDTSLFYVFLLPSRVRDLTHHFTFVECERIEEKPAKREDDWNAGCRKCES